LGKRKDITAACLLLLDGRKEEAQNYVGGLLVQIMAGKKAAGCGRGAEEENSWLLQLA
jgi:hypothetical protein